MSVLALQIALLFLKFSKILFLSFWMLLISIEKKF